MTRTSLIVRGVLVAGVAIWASGLAMTAQQAAAGPVNYTANGELLKPPDFREWVFLSAGLGMTYNPPAATAGAPARPPSFTNVYVNPTSYRTFLQTGAWPEQTIFVLEIRGSASEGSINLGGRYQTALMAVEAEVKDSARFPGGWAYFNFGGTADRTAPLPKNATCYECHGTKAAVEHTFVQFYPTLMDVARKMGTVNRSYAEGVNPQH